MTYKFLNTIIDDLFAFVIKMPLLHRLSGAHRHASVAGWLARLAGGDSPSPCTTTTPAVPSHSLVTRCHYRCLPLPPCLPPCPPSTVFRDDLIFLIYLYQRWVHRVDKKRTNEFG